MARRPEGWRARLNTFIASNLDRPFAWGEFDCCVGLFSGAYEAVTGDSILDEYRGEYDTEQGAFALLKRDGFATPADLITSKLGPRRHKSRVRVGDACLYRGCIGVYTARGARFIGCDRLGDAFTADGLILIPRTDLEYIWHV